MKGTPSLSPCGLSMSIYRLLRRNRWEFTTVDLMQDPELCHFLQIENSPSCCPFLYVEEKFIGGHDELIEMFNAKKLFNPEEN
jgi:glutaredoxin-related protein